MRLKGGHIHIVLLYILISVVFECEGGFTTIQGYTLPPGTVAFQRFGAYTKESSPFGGSDTAHVRYILNFMDNHPNEITNNATTGEVLVFYSDIRQHVGIGGYSVLEGRAYCCSQELFDNKQCDTLHSLIINIPTDHNLNGNVLYYSRVNLTSYDNADHSALLTDFIDIQKTGIWYIFIANCDKPDGMTITITGSIEWKNPFGYLPGQILGYLPLYWIMSVGYLIMGIAWTVSACIHHKDMMNLQHAISFVIFISILENLLWASDYTAYNFVGVVSDWANIFGALFTSTKLTAVRTLMLIVAIGYTITRPVLETRYKIGISILALIYFVVEAANQYIAVVTIAQLPVPDIFQYVDLILLLLVNAIFFVWIGFEMYFTVKKLKASEGEKFGMYKRLSILLVISLTLSVLIIITQLIIEATDQTDVHFRAWWLFDSYWEFVYFACILYVAWVWRPTEQNLRYAYTELSNEEDKSVELEASSINESARDNTTTSTVRDSSTTARGRGDSQSVSSDSSSSDDSVDELQKQTK